LKLQAPVSIVCAKLESEMISLSKEERNEFVAELVEADKIAHVPTLDDLIVLAFNKV
jgi:ribosome-binding ATPase YchF (GTP1/OBG family)